MNMIFICGLNDFNPRSPYGERHIMAYNIGPKIDFNPRSPYGERPRPMPRR